MVLGIELPQSHYYPYKFESLKEGHRERLLKIYYQNMRRIPDNAQLSLPMHRTGAKLIQYDGKAWEADVNPSSSNVEEVLDLWCKAFDESLKIAEESLTKNT